MARCTDCIHYEACLRFADLRVILCGDEADTKCIVFKPTADVAPRAEVAREIFEEIKKIGVVTQVKRSGNIIYDVTAEYTALQKKYTEAETKPPKTD